MKSWKLTTLSAAFMMAVGGGALAATTPPTPNESMNVKAAKDEIDARYKAEKDACRSMTGNAKDVCMEEAKGHQKVAKAELELQRNPTAGHRRDVQVAKADAAYEVAKEKCDDLKGNQKDVCRKDAKAAHVAAKVDAERADKVARAGSREDAAEARREAQDEKRDAQYAAAKERCDALKGDQKDACERDAKTRFGR